LFTVGRLQIHKKPPKKAGFHPKFTPFLGAGGQSYDRHSPNGFMLMRGPNSLGTQGVYGRNVEASKAVELLKKIYKLFRDLEASGVR